MSMKSVLVIDNYDSFTFNLVHILEDLGRDVTVWRNDQFELSEVESFSKVLLSPGPGLPKDAGLLLPLIENYGATKSILGVCLGHQAIGQVYGAQLKNLNQVFHGVDSKLKITSSEDPLFKGLPEEFLVGRYHSWVVENLPDELNATAHDEAGLIMAMRHAELDVAGVQFHPESIMTHYGKELISNWLNN